MKGIKYLISGGADLKKNYYIHFEMGMIMSLLVMIVLVRIDFYPEEKQIEYVKSEEIIQVEEIERTRQESLPPPPPRPPVPVEVPNDEIITDVKIDLDSELNITDELIMPPAPPEQSDNSEETDQNDEIFVIVEEMPVMIGGMSSIYSRLKYPDQALRNNISGKVVLQFVINERGEVTNPEVVRGIGYGCDEEAVRVLREVKFTPGLQRGMPVKVRASIQVIFTLMNK